MMRVDGDMLIFGVVGDPVMQVRTPELINPIFEKRGAKIICVPLHATTEDFPAFWSGMKVIGNIAGIGVTVPHKKQAMELCDTLGPNAEKTGVVNIVKRCGDGRFHGETFDGLSFVNGLKAEGFDPAGHRVFMYGAGGAATAIGYSLIDAKVNALIIQNRTVKNAETLVAELKRRTGFSNVHTAADFDDTATLVINASCLGMKDGDRLPVDVNRLNPSQIVAEVVAKPATTKFLLAAKNTGCSVHSGLHMITHQIDLIADFIDSR